MFRLSPDYGIYFKKRYPNKTTLVLPRFEIHRIAYISGVIYAISQYIKFHEEFQITFEFERAEFKELLKLMGNNNLVNELKKMFFKPLSEYREFDLTGSTIIAGIVATPSPSRDQNINKSYIPFSVKGFFAPECSPVIVYPPSCYDIK